MTQCDSELTDFALLPCDIWQEFISVTLQKHIFPPSRWPSGSDSPGRYATLSLFITQAGDEEVSFFKYYCNNLRFRLLLLFFLPHLPSVKCCTHWQQRRESWRLNPRECRCGSMVWGAAAFLIVSHLRLTCVRAHSHYDLSFSFKENQLKRCSSELPPPMPWGHKSLFLLSVLQTWGDVNLLHLTHINLITD